MNTRRYQAPSMAEAIAEVKRDLGRDAVILRSRLVRRPGFSGLFGGRLWEVTASRAEEIFDAHAGGRYVPHDASEVSPPPAKGVLPVATEPAADGLGQEVGQIRQMLQRLLAAQSASPVALPEPLAAMRMHLLIQQVAPEMVDEIIREASATLSLEQMHDAQAVAERVEAAVAARIRTAVPDETPRQVVALVGPTGVGKTTTVAKLAAWYRLQQNRSVALITMDTYRIAAVDQLRTYAEILSVPLEAVMTPGEMARAIHAFRGADVVLIDTAGRSQRNRQRLEHLGAFLAAASPTQVHLVITATASAQCVEQTVEGFGLLRPSTVILTKIDEAAGLGAAVNVCRRDSLAISHVTTGQEVPHEMQRADSAQLARWIVAGDPGGRTP